MRREERNCCDFKGVPTLAGGARLHRRSFRYPVCQGGRAQGGRLHDSKERGAGSYVWGAGTITGIVKKLTKGTSSPCALVKKALHTYYNPLALSSLS